MTVLDMSGLALPEILARVPGLDRLPRAAIRIERLGGLSNVNYKAVGPGLGAVIRLPGPRTGAYVNRRFEARNYRAAARAGAAPEVLHSDERTGVLVTRFIEGAAPLDLGGAGGRARLDAVTRLVRRLHQETPPFANDFDPFEMLDRYQAILQAGGCPPPDEYVEARNMLFAARPAVAACSRASVPSHCDVLAGNLLDDGERLWFIDFEFSGNCDPLWDLADLSGETGLDPDRERRLLAGYLGKPAPLTSLALFGFFKALSLLLAAFWARVQAAHGNRAADFPAYADARLDRCGAVMGGVEFREWVRRLEDERERQRGRAGAVRPSPQEVQW